MKGKSGGGRSTGGKHSEHCQDTRKHPENTMKGNKRHLTSVGLRTGMLCVEVTCYGLQKRAQRQDSGQLAEIKKRTIR